MWKCGAWRKSLVDYYLPFVSSTPIPFTCLLFGPLWTHTKLFTSLIAFIYRVLDCNDKVCKYCSITFSMILFYYYRYGLIWISTTLVFVLTLLGNLATYLMQKHIDDKTSWKFDVNFVNTAAWSIYGYVIVVPLAYYFFLQYMGSNANLVRFWCMWGYSLTIFILSSVSLRFLCMTCCVIIYLCIIFHVIYLILASHEIFSFYCLFHLRFFGGL
jgi:hypothetical protein